MNDLNLDSKIIAIAVTDINGCISKYVDDSHISQECSIKSKLDLTMFKKTTMYHPCIMGHNTFKSLHCKPLANRANIIITSEAAKNIENIPAQNIVIDENKCEFNRKNIHGRDFIYYTCKENNDIYYVYSLVYALLLADFLNRYNPKYYIGSDPQIYICGGEKIYNDAFGYCDKVIIDIFEKSVKRPVKFFPFTKLFGYPKTMSHKFTDDEEGSFRYCVFDLTQEIKI